MFRKIGFMSESAEVLYKQYSDEFDALHEKYLEPYVITKEDIEGSPRAAMNFGFKEGDTTTRYPKQPESYIEAFDLFKKYYGELQFISCKMHHIQVYGIWSLENVEAEIQELDRFIKSTYAINIEHGNLNESYFLDDGIEIEYTKLTSDYYYRNPIRDDVWDLNVNSMMSRLYGKYVLFYQFLKATHQTLIGFKRENAFSKKHSLEQLDLVLNWFATDKHDAFPHAHFDAIQKSISKKLNYDCFANILYEILEKLERDKHINSWESEVTFYRGNSKTPVKSTVRNYAITWEGRFFISKDVGGYLEEHRNKRERNKRIDTLGENQKENANAMTILTAVLVAGTVMQTLYYFIDLTIRTDKLSKTAFPFIITFIGALEATVAIAIFLRLHLKKSK